MKMIWKLFKPFTDNKYKLKWFNNLNKWFNFDLDLDFEWDFDWKKWEDWMKQNNKKFDWNNWKDWYKPQNNKNKK